MSCVSGWTNQHIVPRLEENGNIKALRVSQFVNDKSIIGKTWENIGDIKKFGFDARIVEIRPGDYPMVGCMLYAIDHDTGEFNWYLGTIDSSG